jgi:hypothetical protein
MADIDWTKIADFMKGPGGALVGQAAGGLFNSAGAALAEPERLHRQAKEDLRTETEDLQNSTMFNMKKNQIGVENIRAGAAAAAGIRQEALANNRLRAFRGSILGR